MSEKMKKKETKEERQYYIFHWAKEVETIQKKQKDDTLLNEKVGFFHLKWLFFTLFGFTCLCLGYFCF